MHSLRQQPGKMLRDVCRDTFVRTSYLVGGSKRATPQAAVPAILLINPNSELYGSDRTFLQTVKAFRGHWPDARMTILLPYEGTLADILRETERDVRIDDIWVPRRARLSETVRRLPALAFRILGASRRMRGYDLTYINTVVVLDYLLASRFAGRRTLIHIHEMTTGKERSVFAAILRWARGRYIFNSQAVCKAFPELRQRDHAVVWNGVRDFSTVRMPSAGTLNLLMIGRFNAWKGQDLLLDALSLLGEAHRARLSVRLVGSVFAGADHFLERIHARIAQHGLGDCVQVFGFDPEPDAHYAWADVVVVPSVKPEPFGLVAIEAMSARRAVIAADHGGLAEIVLDGMTGLRVQPGSAEALAEAIRTYLDDPQLAERHGEAGRVRYDAEFREEAYMAQMIDAATAALA